MSEEAQTPPSLDSELDTQAAELFGAIFDKLEAEEGGTSTAEGEQPAAAPTDGVGQALATAEGTGAAEGQPAAPSAGEGQQPAVPDGAAGEQPAAGAAGQGSTAAPVAAEGVDPKLLAEKWTEMSNALETKLAQGHQATAMESVRNEYGRYFEALEKHPRLIVGSKVPAAGNEPNQDAEGFIVLRDEADAKSWQEASRGLLVQEIRSRAAKLMEEDKGSMQVLHQSIELLQSNPDLIPGTKGFNKELADRFAAITKDYEVRVDGKLHGYSINVLPLVANLRNTLVAEGAAKAAATQAPTATAAGTPAAAAVPPAAAAAPAPAPGPQAGIRSQAGSGGDDEDMSTFWGSIGLPDMKV